MRRRNWRVVITGFPLIFLATVFFFFMSSIASSSTDSMAMMQTAGTVAGTVAGFSAGMIIFGLLGKHA